MTYAIIENNVVANLISLHASNETEFPGALPIGDYPVTLGDICENGMFYRNGEVLKTNTAILQENIDDMKAALAELGVTVNE